MGDQPNPWTYYKASRSERRALSPWQRSALRLCAEVDPQGRSGGAFANRTIRGSSALSTHAVGRAVDWFASSVAARRRIADAFIERDAQDVQLVIVRGSNWGGRRGPGWRESSDGDGYTAVQLHIESRSAHWGDA